MSVQADTEQSFRMEELELGSLAINHNYQRPLNTEAVARIAREFDPVLCGPLEVAQNRNTFEVFDGQHRLAALLQLGVDSWPCRVHPKLPPKGQARAFVDMQAKRRPVHPIDRHKALVFAGDRTAVAVENAVTEAGYRITRNPTHGSIMCVSALYLCYERYGQSAGLQHALGVIDEIWGMDDHYSRKASMVAGMALFLHHYGDEIDHAAFVSKLKGQPSARIVRDAANERGLQTHKGLGTERVSVARVLAESYNSGRRTLTAEQVAQGISPRRISLSKLGKGA